MARLEDQARASNDRGIPEGTRAIGLTLPAGLVTELDRGLAERRLFNCRSRAIAIAVRRFIDDGGLDAVGESATSGER